MKRLLLALATLLALGASGRAATQQTFLECFWENTVTNPSVAVWAGGNESSTNDAPRSANGVLLVESAIGQMTPQTLGYPQAAADLAALADTAKFNGSAYRYTPSGGTIITNPAVSWNLVFPGGFNPTDGTTYPSNVIGSTYHSDQLDLAEYALRARLRINPLDTDAARKLVLLVEERCLPLEFSGSEALAYSAKSRLLGQNAALKEIPAIELARGYFSNACNVFAQFLANPPDALLVEGQNPLLSSFVTNEVNEIVDVYLRNLARYAASSFADFQLRNLSDFRDPALQPPDPQPTGLLNEIDAAQSEIQLRLLLASPFQGLPAYTFNEAGRIQSLLRDLSRLHESVVMGRVTFVAGASTDASSNPGLRYGEYTTSYVPIFSGLQSSGNSSFDIALSLARQFATDAQPLETAAKADVDLVLQRQYDYQTAQNNLQVQYAGELLNLCGYNDVDTNGNPVPDVLFAAFPPGTRESIGSQLLTNEFYSPLNTGTIYQQWLSLQTAQTNLLLANHQLDNTFSEMLVKKQVADAIYTNQVRIANLILSNGQQVAGLDLQKGEIQAQGALAIAQIQAATAETEAEISAVSGELTGIANGASTGGWWGALAGGGIAAIGAGATLANGYETAAADLQIGQVQARTDRQLAAVDAQITQINASERAQMQYAAADQTMLQLSEALNSLRLQAGSQRIQIQLAAQNVDQERSKLANMLARVAYLLRQYSRSAGLLAQNPQLSRDLLIERDDKIQQAEDAFLLAQQWAFLAAQSFYYKDNCPDASTNRFIPRILGTRNATDLQGILDDMQSANTTLAAQCQSSVFYNSAHISLRNSVFQSNLTQGEGTNTTFLAFEPTLLNGTLGTSAAASYAAWTAFLQQHLITNQFSQRVLVLDFSTSFDQHLVNGLQSNPLFKCPTFGATLYSGPDNNGNQLHGVQMSATTSGFNFPCGANQGFVVQLAQKSTSTIRSKGFGCSASATTPAFRYFNFGYYATLITAAANSLDANVGTAAFQDRSPANGQWTLSINESDSCNNGALLSHLDQLADIELRFSLRSYIDQCAAQACGGP